MIVLIKHVLSLGAEYVASLKHIWTHTKGSNVLMSFNLLPLRFKCVRLGSFSAKTSRPPLILLSLNSSWNVSRRSYYRWHSSQFHTEEWRFKMGLTFFSFPSFGRLDTEIKPTFIKLRNSRLTNSAVRPSIFPSTDRQLSRTSSRTWKNNK